MHPVLAAAGPSLRQGERSEKHETRGKKGEEAGYREAYRGDRIPSNVTQKVYHRRVIVTGGEKRGCTIHTYEWYVR